ncbi:hypothetical protein KYB31_02145 [Clostridium felsineum]|uniref:hypothetical protein n=1 Tax=Clostridium felsineum TaxID=36839 RepID=UPI00214D5461|nr:hypothetical protein [Clostridium felsineum]MCR3757796.1 hypothetical protein [Clostridium felsineum]
MSNIYNIVSHNIKKANRGKELWKNIKNKLKLEDKDFVILIPSLNREYNYYGILYLDQYLKQNKAKRGFVLTVDESATANVHRFSNRVNKIIDISREEAELLMEFYSLYKFSNNFTIVSLEEPKGRSGKNIVGKFGITVEEAIAVGVYGIRDYKKTDCKVLDR